MFEVRGFAEPVRRNVLWFGKTFSGCRASQRTPPLICRLEQSGYPDISSAVTNKQNVSV